MTRYTASYYDVKKKKGETWNNAMMRLARKKVPKNRVAVKVKAKKYGVVHRFDIITRARKKR